MRVLGFLVALLLAFVAGSPAHAYQLLGATALPPPPPNGIPAAIGPTYSGLIPAPASALGFTTLAANYDFTSAANFTFGGKTYNFSNVSSWMSCGATTPTNSQPLWFQNARWLGMVGTGEVACNEIAIVPDPVYPTVVPQVLSLSVGPGDTAPLSIGTAGQGCGLNGGTTVGGCWGLFPTMNAYVETVFRLDPASIASYATRAGNVGFASWALGAFEYDKEVDFIENFGSVFDYYLALNTTNNAGSANFPAPYDNNYHTMGLLISGSASAGVITACPYFDGKAVATSCESASASRFAQQEGYLILWNTYNINQMVIPPTNPVPEYIKAVRVWTCAGWNNTTPPTFNTSSKNSCATASPPTLPP